VVVRGVCQATCLAPFKRLEALRVEAKERTSAPPAGSRAISRHNPGDQHAESALSDSPDVTHRAGNNSVDLQGVMSVDGPISLKKDCSKSL